MCGPSFQLANLDTIVVCEWPDFSVVLQGLGRPRRGKQLVGRAVNTLHLSVRVTVAFGYEGCCPQAITIVTSFITDQNNKYKNDETV